MQNIIFLLPLAIALSACTSVTPIAELTLPSPTHIVGEVSEIEEDGEELVLKDASGDIEVDLEHLDQLPGDLRIGEQVRVAGYYDVDGDFDAVALTRTYEANE